MSTLATRCVGAAAGLALDRMTGEPADHLHPVAMFGSAMGRVEDRLWADRRSRGVAYAGIGVGIGLVAGKLVGSTTLVVAVAAAGHQLRSTAGRIGAAAASGDLEHARSELPSLVGRDPSQLDLGGICAAVVESVAENGVDAVIAPVFWAVVAGAPGAAAYRAVNTMDAMVGHRNERYENFGWAAARLDDAANYIPARLFALFVVLVEPSRRRLISEVIRRDAPAHPSPNAGVAEAAFAAALGCELGGPLRYGNRLEERPTLGNGNRPNANDVLGANNLLNRVECVAAAGLLATALLHKIWRST